MIVKSICSSLRSKSKNYNTVTDILKYRIPGKQSNKFDSERSEQMFNNNNIIIIYNKCIFFLVFFYKCVQTFYPKELCKCFGVENSF